MEAAKLAILGEIRSEIEASKEEIKGMIRSKLEDLKKEMVAMIDGRPDAAAEDAEVDYQTRRESKFKRCDTVDQTNAAIIEWLNDEGNTTWLLKDLVSGPGKLDWDKQTPTKWTGPLMKRLLSDELIEERRWKSPHRTPPLHKRLPSELHDFIISVIKKGTGIGDAEEDIDLVMHKRLAKVFVQAAWDKKKREGIPTKKRVKKPRKPSHQAEKHTADLSPGCNEASTSKGLVNAEDDGKIISSDEDDQEVDPPETTVAEAAPANKSRGRPNKRAKEQVGNSERVLRSRM